MKAFSESGPPRCEDGGILLRTLWARQGNDLTVVSWNAQLMNKLDEPNDKEIAGAIVDKVERISRVVAEPCKGGAPASLLVIQEAPGPQLRDSGGKNAKKIAAEGTFTQALRNKLSRLNFQEVALGNQNNSQGKEMGEDHIFGWDPAVLTLVQPGPQALDPPEGQSWVARAPSWAEFEVAKIWGEGHRLIVVSVHAKSGGESQTVNDVRMIGDAVSCLKAQRLSDQDSPLNLSILITGDFNLGPEPISKQIPEDYTLAFRSVTECPKTNIWRFNGCGDEASDGHAYDSGFFSSTMTGYSVSAVLPPALAEQVQVHEEMQRMAAAVLQSLRELPNQTTGMSQITQRTMDAILNTTGAADGVPSWLRKEFCHSVKLTWSDHMPIAVSVAMPWPRREPEPQPE